MKSSRLEDLEKVQNDFTRNDPSGAAKFFRDKMTFTTGPVELNSAIEKGAKVVVIDVRERADYEKGHVPGAISLPKEEWESRHHLDRDGLNVFYCYSSVCHLGARACLLFSTEGYSVMEMDGGFKAWQENGLKTEGGERKAA